MQKLIKTPKDYCAAVNKSDASVFFETAGGPAVTFVRLDSHTFDVWIAPNEEGQYIQSDIVIFNSLEEDCVSSGMKRIASKLLNTSEENLTMRHWRKFHTHSQGETTMHPDQRSVKQVMTDDFLAVANANFNISFNSITEDGCKDKTDVTFVKVPPVCFQAWETNDLSGHCAYIRLVYVGEGDDEKQFSMLREFAAQHLGVKEKTLVAIYNRYPIQPSKGKDVMQDDMNTTTADQPTWEAVQEQRAVFPAVNNEEGLCLSVGLNDQASINAVSGNRYAPVETVSFVDPSMTVEVKTDQIGDTLVACVARMRKLRFIVYSCDGAKYFHILGAGQSMTGLYNSVVNDKVLYWTISGDLKEELVILDTPKVDAVGCWVRKEDLLYQILPVYRKKDSLDPVLEAALRCASFQAIKSYITWAENLSDYAYPDTQQTLKHLQGG